MNVAYSLSAWPVGALSDRVGRPVLLGIGLALLIAADVALAFAGGAATLALGVALWGLHMGFTQSLLATLVADRSPPALRGTAFGLYGLVTGVALLLASAVAVLLWDAFGARATFLAGAAFALLALLGLLVLDRAPRDGT